MCLNERKMNNMNRIWILGLAVISVVAIIGCSGGGAVVEKQVKVDLPAGKPIDGKLKVALLTPGPVSDSGWNAMAFDGLKAIESELGAEVSHQVATDAGIKDAMRTFAGDGYNLVLGHGFEYNEPENQVAPDFPNTVFVSSSGGKTSANAGAFRFYLEQSFYLCGYLAGKLSKSGTVAMIGGPEVESIKSTFKGFAAGAKAANPQIKVIEKFTGKESDTAAAKLATLQAISEGADFVIHQANAAASGVFQACEEKKVFCFGANLNQNAESAQVIASAVIVAKPAFVSLAKKVKSGEYTGAVELMGMKEGAVDFIVSPSHSGDIPDSIRKQLDNLIAEIILGRLEVPMDKF